MKFYTLLALMAAPTLVGQALAQDARADSPILASGNAPAYRAIVDPSRNYPDADKARRKGGAFVLPAAILNVVPGMTKSQVYTLLDVPHFNEGLFGEKKWDYVFNLYTGTGNDYVTCQFQVIYRKGRVENTYWKDQACADLTNPKASVSTVKVEKIVYGDGATSKSAYAFYFPFDSSQVDVANSSQANEIASTINAGNYNNISVVGMTDTSGTDQYNYGLAMRRAQSVAGSLRRAGVSDANIVVSASPDLAVPTGDEVREQKNRRVLVILGKK